MVAVAIQPLQNAVGGTPEALNEVSMCLSLAMGRFGTRRKLPTQLVSIDANKAWLGARKTILESPALKRVRSHDRETWEFVEHRSVPSLFRGGIYRIPHKFVEEVDDWLTKRLDERGALVDAFVDEYPAAIKAAKSELRAAFAERDYPTKEAVRSEFLLKWDWMQVGTPKDLKKVGGKAFHRQMVKERAEAQAMMGEIGMILRQQMHALVSKLAERLTAKTAEGKPATFHDTTVSKVKEFLELFDARNLCDDQDLRAMADKARSLLEGADANTLRGDSLFRADIGKGFEELASALNAEIEAGGPVRRLRFDDEEE